VDDTTRQRLLDRAALPERVAEVDADVAAERRGDDLGPEISSQELRELVVHLHRPT
jgi:hypothetical protein